MADKQNGHYVFHRFISGQKRFFSGTHSYPDGMLMSIRLSRMHELDGYDKARVHEVIRQAMPSCRCPPGAPNPCRKKAEYLAASIARNKDYIIRLSKLLPDESDESSGAGEKPQDLFP